MTIQHYDAYVCEIDELYLLLDIIRDGLVVSKMDNAIATRDCTGNSMYQILEYWLAYRLSKWYSIPVVSEVTTTPDQDILHMLDKNVISLTPVVERIVPSGWTIPRGATLKVLSPYAIVIYDPYKAKVDYVRR